MLFTTTNNVNTLPYHSRRWTREAMEVSERRQFLYRCFFVDSVVSIV